jgi:hypothetical protein
MCTQQDNLEKAELQKTVDRLTQDLQYSVDNNAILQRAYNNLDQELQELKQVIKRCFDE